MNLDACHGESFRLPMRHSIARRRAAAADAATFRVTANGDGDVAASGALAASGRTARLSDTRKAWPGNERHNRLCEPLHEGQVLHLPNVGIERLPEAVRSTDGLGRR